MNILLTNMFEDGKQHCNCIWKLDPFSIYIKNAPLDISTPHTQDNQRGAGDWAQTVNENIQTLYIKLDEQAGAELGQAQFKKRLPYTASPC
jgi:hypothetical protein